MVYDIGAALAELARRGVSDLGEAGDAHEGSGRRAIVQDPDGVRFELLDRPALLPAIVTD